MRMPRDPLGLPLSIQQKVRYPTLCDHIGYTLVLLGWLWCTFVITMYCIREMHTPWSPLSYPIDNIVHFGIILGYPLV